MTIRTFEEKTPSLGMRVFIDNTALVIGNVTLGDDASVWPMSVIRGDIHTIKIGARSNIQDGTVIHVSHAGEFNPEGNPVTIGEEVIIGHHVTLHGCEIMDQSLIGIGARVLDGAVVEPNVIVGAGSLVPPGKTLKSGFLYVGTPVKQVRQLSSKELAYFSYSANYYVALKDKHQKALQTS